MFSLPISPSDILDPFQPPSSLPVKELHSTLDGRHWDIAESKPPFCHSQPPTGDPSAADSGDSSSGDSTIIVHPPAVDFKERSFFDDFLPPGLSSARLIESSGGMTSAVTGAVASAVTSAVASAVTGAVASASGAMRTSAVAAVRTIFYPNRMDPDRTGSDTPDPDYVDPSRADPEYFCPDTKTSSTESSTFDDMAPTQQQFNELQQRYEALQKQLDKVVSRQSTDHRAWAIDEDSERRRKEAYESAGPPYTPLNVPGCSPDKLVPFGPHHTEYQISHKSVGYLRPAEASTKPFKAMDREVYVRSLAWLAHLRTKLDLKEDFHYKNQVLQVASEWLVGRAAA